MSAQGPGLAYVIQGDQVVEVRVRDGKPLRQWPFALVRAAPRMLDLLRGAGDWYCGELPDGTDRRKAIATLLAEIDKENDEC